MLRPLEISFDKEIPLEELAGMNLRGRPFLSEQGDAVTRGLVDQFTYEDEHWSLLLYDIDYLYKFSGIWQRECESDTYGGPLRLANPKSGILMAEGRKDMFLDIGGYGMFVLIGPETDSPWTEIIWPDRLDTFVFDGGRLGVWALTEFQDIPECQYD